MWNGEEHEPEQSVPTAGAREARLVEAEAELAQLEQLALDEAAARRALDPKLLLVVLGAQVRATVAREELCARQLLLAHYSTCR